MSPPSGDAQFTYDGLIESELDREHARRRSIDDRSARVATTSAGLLTLSVAVFATVLGKDYVLQGWALYLVGFALLAFLIAAAVAVVAGVAWNYNAVSGATLLAMARERRGDDLATQAAGVAYSRVASLRSLRRGNGTKARWLLAASISELLALVALAVSLLFVLPKP